MGKSFNQKLKLLYIMQMLKENTDENHAMSANDIISALAKQGISAPLLFLWGWVYSLVFAFFYVV